MVRAALHEEKVAAARRIRVLRARPRGCIIRHYSDGRDVMANGLRGSMFCIWCPDMQGIPTDCPETCIAAEHITCKHLGLCPCSVAYGRARLRAFMRWLIRHYREQVTDRMILSRRTMAVGDDDY